MIDPPERPRQLRFSERNIMIIKPEEYVLQQEVESFCQFTIDNRFVINNGKCVVMKFNRSRKYDFPPEVQVEGGSTVNPENFRHPSGGYI